MKNWIVNVDDDAVAVVHIFRSSHSCLLHFSFFVFYWLYKSFDKLITRNDNAIIKSFNDELIIMLCKLKYFQFNERHFFSYIFLHLAVAIFYSTPTLRIHNFLYIFVMILTHLRQLQLKWWWFLTWFTHIKTQQSSKNI